uniref:Acetylcholine receptor subunit alpha-like n=1 Tax=Apis cerana TaxID=7461 RepID=V9ICJ1_APICE
MPPIIGETLRVWFLSALVVHGAVAGNPDAKRLYDDLLSNYNKLVRPVVNTSDVLRVCIKLKLSQLIDVVSENLILKHPLKRLDLIYGSYNLISASYKKN